MAIYAFSLLAPSDSSKQRFSPGTINMICNSGSWPQNDLTTPEAHSEQVCSIVWNLLFSVQQLDGASEMSVVLIFDICNVYKIVTYDWLYSQYRVQVMTIDMALKFRGNIEDLHLFLVCWADLVLWNGKTKSVLSNFKRMT